MTKFDDVRDLSLIDTHHGVLRHMEDSALARYTIDVQREGGQVLVVCAMEQLVCPADPTALWRIKYWLADSGHELRRALTRSSLAVIREMEQRGLQRVWGAVPNQIDYLLTFLDRVVAAGLCTKVIGASIDDAEERGYDQFTFYIADRDEAKQFMRRPL